MNADPTNNRRGDDYSLSYLYETNIKGSLSETLPTHVEVIFTDDGGRIGCNDKKKNIIRQDITQMTIERELR